MEGGAEIGVLAWIIHEPERKGRSCFIRKGDRDRALFGICLHTGCRISEALALPGFPGCCHPLSRFSFDRSDLNLCPERILDWIDRTRQTKTLLQ